MYLNFFKKNKTLLPVSLTSIPVKYQENYLKNNTIIRHSQHGVTNGKSFLSNFISFNCKAVCLVDEWEAVDIVYTNKAFDAVPLDKLSN